MKEHKKIDVKSKVDKYNKRMNDQKTVKADVTSLKNKTK